LPFAVLLAVPVPSRQVRPEVARKVKGKFDGASYSEDMTQD